MGLDGASKVVRSLCELAAVLIELKYGEGVGGDGVPHSSRHIIRFGAAARVWLLCLLLLLSASCESLRSGILGSSVPGDAWKGSPLLALLDTFGVRADDGPCSFGELNVDCRMS